MALIPVMVNGHRVWRETAGEEAERCTNPKCKRTRWNSILGRNRALFSYDDTLWAFCNSRCFAEFWEGILRKHGAEFEKFVQKLSLDNQIPSHVMRHPKFFADLYETAVAMADSGDYSKEGAVRKRRLPAAAA